ncbi:MAG: DNA polymerase IV [Methanospirillaceae archaeon]|nr:DNA polymerase IV [Methanospirillaceae archaeon]
MIPHDQNTRIIMHVDMDSFYASVEIAHHPDLYGKPVVIGADPRLNRGVISTCSYEARTFGLHSGMPISQAYQLCPQAVYLPVNMNLYRLVSERIMTILKQYSDLFEQVSIDEAFLDISQSYTYLSSPILAKEIKREIQEKEGLLCSVGIAPSRYYAKMASDFDKPDGMTIITPGDLLSFLENLPVSAIPGVGKHRFSLLKRAGIETIGDLGRTDLFTLVSIAGNWGIMMHHIALGLDTTGIRVAQPRRSIGRETTFLCDTDDPTGMRETLLHLTTSVHHTLVDSHLLCKTITVKIRDSDFCTKTRAVTIPTETDDLKTIIAEIMNIFTELYNGDTVRLIGVRLSGLVQKKSVQTSIFDYLS